MLEARVVGQHASLTPTQLRALVDTALALETLFGHPQDIEFAIAGGRIHILQTRPISTDSDLLEYRAARYRQREIDRLRNRIAELRRKGKIECGEAVYSDGNITEILPTPTPMSFGIFTSIFSDEGGIQRGRRRLGYTFGDETSEGLFELICGHPYFNLGAGCQDVPGRFSPRHRSLSESGEGRSAPGQLSRAGTVSAGVAP
ncbi:MAG: hypothetical protein M5R38_11625 [Candidatus Methylomirabilis sp.]|nr:hypothetical protein [Candidatus Methylomirabilis sp.]